MIRVRTALLLGATVVGVGLLGVWRHDVSREADRRAAVETSRIRGWARAQGGAGISVLPKRVPRADPDQLDDLDTLPGFDAFATRCASCHELPDPAAYPSRTWAGKVHEMKEHIGKSGLMPPDDEEMAAVIDFLRQAAAELGDTR